MIVDEKGNTITDAPAMPALTERQEQEAEDRTSVSALVVHEAIRKDGDEELRRPISALAWSGLAAGLSMGFSFVAEALFRTYTPAAPWRPLITNLGYPLGFLIVIVGRQQLFTENTLTAIIPLLARRNLATFWQVLRLWCRGSGREHRGRAYLRLGARQHIRAACEVSPGAGSTGDGSGGCFLRHCHLARYLRRMADRDGGVDAGRD